MKVFIKEIEIKTTVRYHLTPVKMIIVEKRSNKYYNKGMEKMETLYMFTGM